MKNKNKINQVSEKKRAAIYCRVSTVMQGSADYSSLDAQEDQLRAYCKGKDWEIAGIYKDTKSGGTLEREELNNLLSDAEKEKFNVIFVTKIDRLSRSMMDFKTLLRDLMILWVHYTKAVNKFSVL